VSAGLRELTISTVDGRSLTVYDAGDPTGRPIVFHHGTPSSGRPFEPHIVFAQTHGVRLVSYDRAGYGSSDRDAGRSVADVVDDVAAIADTFGLERFATWGLSGGGPHALATAAGLPDRVVAVATAASVAPPDRPRFDLTDGMGEGNIVEFGLAREGEEALRPLLEQESAGLDELDLQGLVGRMRTVLSDLDAATLEDDFGEYMLAGFRAALARGVDGWLDDDLAFVRPWGFELEAVGAPALVIQGRHDLMVPWHHGEWLAETVPSAESWLREDEGHLTLFVRLAPAINDWLLARF
jgi:pimeloyl-ACP methyl ester carboxylesterase